MQYKHKCKICIYIKSYNPKNQGPARKLSQLIFLATARIPSVDARWLSELARPMNIGHRARSLLGPRSEYKLLKFNPGLSG
jgi:hypothetical protein